ncbi:hypothetical protein [Leptolyngbya ohadii]|uniref:hypothetical protein n=1 Tax=Leptolyngbya ohadii TaxID=1962290 RepID=UPI000B599A4D|nr:hypothetical protein [Leptolyngbya ohadii]
MTQEPKSPSKTATLQRLLGQVGGIVLAVVSAIAKFVGNLWWNTLLPVIQGLLPAPWNRRLSKPVLTGIAIALLTLILWLTSTLNRPAVSSVSESPSAPIAERPVAKAPRPEPALTPEKLIRIEEKLAQVAEPYGESLIASVKPGERQHLKLTLDDHWFILPADSQDRLAKELWQRSRQLDYDQLEILDLENQRIARSPVVGEQMLILKRSGRVPVEVSPAVEEAIEPVEGLTPESAPGFTSETDLEQIPELPSTESASETEELSAEGIDG